MCLPFLRAVYSMGDEGILLNGAVRMLHGEVLYKNFFEFLPPGGFLITAFWVSLAGDSFFSARFLDLLVTIGVTGLTFLATRKATQNAWFSAIIIIAWAAASQGPLINLPSHHWFTTLFSMIGFWAALARLQRLQHVLRWAFLAGAAEGIAVMVTPTCGALAWLAAASFFLRQGPKECLAYLSASALAPMFLLAYLIAHNDLAFAYADCIRFPAAHYASIQGVPFGFGANPQNYPLFYLFPVAGLLTVLVCILNGRSCLRDQRLHLCVAFAVAGFIGCFPRPDLTHIGYATPLALPIFAYCATSLAQHCTPIFAAILLELLITLCLPSVLAYGFMAHKSLHPKLTPTPRGAVALIGQTGAAGMLVRLAAMPPGATYFFYPYMPLMSFLTGREQVSKYDLFAPGYTLPSQYQDTCLAVMQRADWVVIDRQYTPAYWKKAFPAMQNPDPPEAQGFETALNRGFDLAFRAWPYELLHRNSSASIALCTGIAR
jgi:hypothetical protein